MEIQTSMIVAFVLAVIVLLLLGRLMIIPVKIVMRIIYNIILGGLALWVLNLVTGWFGIHFALNPYTAAIAGFLGVPGVIMLYVLQVLL